MLNAEAGRFPHVVPDRLIAHLYLCNPVLLLFLV